MHSAIEKMTQPIDAESVPQAPLPLAESDSQGTHGKAKKLIASLTVSAVLGTPLALTADKYFTDTFGFHPSPTIEEVGTSLPCKDASTITSYENGMGETNARKVAVFASLALEKHDSCTTYVDDGDTARPTLIAHEFIDFLHTNTKPGEKKHIVFNGLSTGALVLLQTVIELQKHDDLPIKDITIVLDSTPDTYSTVKLGADFNLPQIFIDNCENLPGGMLTNTITKAYLYTDAALKGKDVTKLDTQYDLDYAAKGMELPRIASQACAIKNTPSTLQQLSTMRFNYPMRAVYLRGTEDAVVDSEQASANLQTDLGFHTLLIFPVGHEVQIGLGEALPDFIKSLMDQLFPEPKNSPAPHCITPAPRRACPV